MQPVINRVEQALADLKQGKMIILTDDPDRENEGDLIALAEYISPEIMNFMIRNGTGIVCLSATPTLLEKFKLPLMVDTTHNTSCRGTPFTISIDAAHDITTGVSAEDRAKTVLAFIANNAVENDLVRPGHIFPLQAKEGGVLERQGHTEGAIDLARLANCKPAAVLCEIMNTDGTMTCGKKLDEFAQEHQLTMISIEDIITYRLSTENFIAEESTTTIPLTEYGSFQVTAIKEKMTNNEHLVFVKKQTNTDGPTLVRVHSSCKTGDIFSSERCDCYKQLQYALQRISKEGGVLIYLNQEGRGIGLFNKICAYALQDQGYDTVDANLELGFPIDSRKYHIAANILRNLNIQRIRILTNNFEKMTDLKKYGIQHVEREATPSFSNKHNQIYLKTKKEKMNQAIQFESITELKGMTS